MGRVDPNDIIANDQIVISQLAAEIDALRRANNRKAAPAPTAAPKSARSGRMTESERENIRREIMLDQARQEERDRELVERVKLQDVEDQRRKEEHDRELVERIRLQDIEDQRREQEHDAAIIARAKLKAAKAEQDEADQIVQYELKRKAAELKREQKREQEREVFEVAMRETLYRSGVSQSVIERVVRNNPYAADRIAVGDTGACPVIRKSYLSRSTLRRFNVWIEDNDVRRGNKPTLWSSLIRFQCRDDFWILPSSTSEDTIRDMFAYERDRRRTDDSRDRHDRKQTWKWFR